MTQNVNNVYAAKPIAGGAVWSAPYGTPVPTDAITPLSDEFKSLGYISEDGITETPETKSEPKKAYGGDEVLNTQTEHSMKYKFKPIEINTVALAEIYGEDNVGLDETGNLVIRVNSQEHAPRVYVLEQLLSRNRVERTVIPNGKVTEVGERLYKDGEPLGNELTVTAMPGFDDGDKAKKYLATIADTEEEPEDDLNADAGTDEGAGDESGAGTDEGAEA